MSVWYGSDCSVVMVEVSSVIIIVLLIALGSGLFVLFQQNEETRKMVAASLDKLTQESERAATVQQATVVLLNNLRDQLNDLANHPDAEKIRELAAQLAAHTDKLAEAISDHEE